MFASIRKAREKESGFTLIELLVVIIIIGILAAIAIPTFLNQRKKGWEKATISELRNAAVAQESYATENNGTYATTVAQLKAEGFNNSADQVANFKIVTLATPGKQSWCMEAKHDSHDITFAQLSSDGTVVKNRTCPTSLLGDGTDALVTPAP